MSRFAFLAVSTMAMTLTTVGCETEGENPNFGAFTIATGECEGSAYDKDMDTGATDPTAIWAEADGRDVILHLDNLDANCCPSADAVITMDGSDILVEFDDVTTEDPCDCICVMDFEITIEDLDPGTYTIEVDYDGGIIGDAEVEIEA